MFSNKPTAGDKKRISHPWGCELFGLDREETARLLYAGRQTVSRDEARNLMSAQLYYNVWETVLSTSQIQSRMCCTVVACSYPRVNEGVWYISVEREWRIIVQFKWCSTCHLLFSPSAQLCGELIIYFLDRNDVNSDSNDEKILFRLKLTTY